MRRVAAVVAVAAGVVLLPATTASAHPLGNFTVNHYDGFTFTAQAVTDDAVVDFAEIPTAQARADVDVDGNGTVTADEQASYAARTCDRVAAAVAVTTGTGRLPLRATASTFTYRPGAAGLQTSRVECMLTARWHVASATTVTVADRFDSDRIGWREITATASGVHLPAATVPQRSVSDRLLHYPNDLLSSPLNVRAATLRVLPGVGESSVARGLAKVPGAGPLARGVAALDRTLGSLAGQRHLTVGVGLLAVLMSLLLGAAHAALPGHGKTVMAAYLAGKRGTRRDAVVVGATVTVTHTAGVLLLGLGLTLSSSLAGERVTGLLGAVSGALIVAVGLGLLSSALRQRRHGHSHDHEHPHPHGHGHGPEHEHRHGRSSLVGMGIAGGLVPSPSALVVLLGAVALGRTVFGVLLVLVYGLGMAATLTAAGLLLVTATERLRRRPRLAAAGGRVAALVPATTSVVVVAVGIGLAMRSAVTL